jgi:gamma-glutamylcyclotransferase (GGCT)/AIG2-like uncharacterized protein YtfP
MLKYYFAFGSNMNPQRMKKRGVKFKSCQRAVLKDHKLVFNKQAYRGNPNEGYANIEPCEGCIVEGVLYELRYPEEGIAKLDYYEGFYGENDPDNHYNRVIVEVETDDGRKVKAYTYIANPRRVNNNLKPTEDYKKNLLEACELGILSEEYCEFLRSVETLD